MVSTAPTLVDPRYNIAGTGKQIVLIWGGTNDIINGGTPAATYANAVQYGMDRKALGWKVIFYTMLPRGTIPGIETNRQTLNALLLADFPTPTAFTNIYTGAAWADVLVDVGADATIGVPGSQFNLTYYSPDQIHLTNAGYTVVAGYAKQALSVVVATP